MESLKELIETMCATDVIDTWIPDRRADVGFIKFGNQSDRNEFLRITDKTKMPRTIGGINVVLTGKT